MHLYFAHRNNRWVIIDNVFPSYVASNTPINIDIGETSGGGGGG